MIDIKNLDIQDWIYVIAINDKLDADYGWFENYEVAKAKAKEIATEYGMNTRDCGMSGCVYSDEKHVISIIKIDYHKFAQY